MRNCFSALEMRFALRYNCVYRRSAQWLETYGVVRHRVSGDHPMASVALCQQASRSPMEVDP